MAIEVYVQEPEIPIAYAADDHAEAESVRYAFLKGDPGAPGVSPSVSVSEITGGHEVAITDAEGTHTFDVMNGVDGDPGAPGVATVFFPPRCPG